MRVAIYLYLSGVDFDVSEIADCGCGVWTNGLYFQFGDFRAVVARGGQRWRGYRRFVHRRFGGAIASIVAIPSPW